MLPRLRLCGVFAEPEIKREQGGPGQGSERIGHHIPYVHGAAADKNTLHHFCKYPKKDTKAYAQQEQCLEINILKAVLFALAIQHEYDQHKKYIGMRQKIVTGKCIQVLESFCR